MEDTNLLNEARKVVSEIESLVKEAKVSDVMSSGPTCAYINVTTNEDIMMCIQLTVNGYRVG